jgi:hypothetical protein
MPAPEREILSPIKSKKIKFFKAEEKIKEDEEEKTSPVIVKTK